jgi:hypothetical protein
MKKIGVGFHFEDYKAARKNENIFLLTSHHSGTKDTKMYLVFRV